MPQVKEKVGSSLEYPGTGNHFLNRTPVAQTLKATISKWELLKLKSFSKAKDMVNKTKWQSTEWENIFTNPTSDRGLISKIYKELKNLDIKIPDNSIKKWGAVLNRVPNRRISDGQKTFKELLNILSLQEKCKSK